MKKLYAIIEIGCIECGCDTEVWGVWDNEQEARNKAEELEKKFYWRQGGENRFVVFPLPLEINHIFPPKSLEEADITSARRYFSELCKKGRPQ